MSGGVDSSVAAALLVEEGYDVIGAMMKFPVYGTSRENSCCGSEAVESALRAAKKLNIPFKFYDHVESFNREVVEYFCREYARGRTPNPCAVCNRALKFNGLFKKAGRLGADSIATGHYARIEKDNSGRYLLKKGKDETKDQSYFLFLLSQKQLARIKFPLGNYRKDEIKKIAKELGLKVHDRPESQEICFVQDDYREFLKEMADAGKFNMDKSIFKPGDMVTADGKKVGTHQGIAFYTVGQRRGLGAHNRPVYVVNIDAANNRVIIGDDEELFVKELTADNVNWIDREKLAAPAEFSVKIRYQHKGAPARVVLGKEGSVKITFKEPQRAVTPGQAAVFYRGETVSGGGWIK